MKLISIIYLTIGLLLAMLCFVTFGYIKQTKNVRRSIEEVTKTSDIINVGVHSQKLLIDMETGLRGYLLTNNPQFLDPYNEGKAGFTQNINVLDSITKAYPIQNRLVQAIKKLSVQWQDTFAVPLINRRKHAHLTPSHQAEYDSAFYNLALKEVGKKLMDKTRVQFDLLKQEEEKLKAARVEELNSSLARTNEIAIFLTFLTILVGSFMANLLGNTIKKRFERMNNLANSIAAGNYSVSLADNRNDEISSLTSSLNTMASKLQSSFSHLTKMNKELDQFAYVVSHDLKAPLRAINNLAEWIAEDLPTEDPDITKNITILRGRVQRMENLINGILDYSRVGRQSLPVSTFPMQELLKETLENISPPATFTISTPSRLPVITGERTLFYQVLSNLLSNAFKYHHTQQGHVEIHYKELPDFHQFQVKDDGPGIPKEFHDKVFRIFQTMEARDVKESTGVGLAIVKKIIEEKGGTIWIESEPDKGTSFFFTWPKNSTLNFNSSPSAS